MLTVYEFIRDIVESNELCIIVDGDTNVAVIKDTETFHQNKINIDLAEKFVLKEEFTKQGRDNNIPVCTIYV